MPGGPVGAPASSTGTKSSRPRLGDLDVSDCDVALTKVEQVEVVKHGFHGSASYPMNEEGDVMFSGHAGCQQQGVRAHRADDGHRGYVDHHVRRAMQKVVGDQQRQIGGGSLSSSPAM